MAGNDDFIRAFAMLGDAIAGYRKREAEASKQDRLSKILNATQEVDDRLLQESQNSLKPLLEKRDFLSNSLQALSEKLQKAPEGSKDASVYADQALETHLQQQNINEQIFKQRKAVTDQRAELGKRLRTKFIAEGASPQMMQQVSELYPSLKQQQAQEINLELQAQSNRNSLFKQLLKRGEASAKRDPVQDHIKKKRIDNKIDLKQAEIKGFKIATDPDAMGFVAVPTQKDRTNVQEGQALYSEALSAKRSVDSFLKSTKEGKATNEQRAEAVVYIERLVDIARKFANTGVPSTAEMKRFESQIGTIEPAVKSLSALIKQGAEEAKIQAAFTAVPEQVEAFVGSIGNAVASVVHTTNYVPDESLPLHKIYKKFTEEEDKKQKQFGGRGKNIELNAADWENAPKAQKSLIMQVDSELDNTVDATEKKTIQRRTNKLMKWTTKE